MKVGTQQGPTTDAHEKAQSKLTDVRAKSLSELESIVGSHPPTQYQMLIVLRYRAMNHLRATVYRDAKGLGYDCVSYVSSRATVWPNVSIGDNCMVFEHTVLQPFSRIGNNVIIGVSGGEYGIRGHVTAYDAVTGKQVVWAGGMTYARNRFAPFRERFFRMPRQIGFVPVPRTED
jgi:UDP-3-O-[3-hydroxymyristoyl] glucosamine N-acyltransferase